MKIIALILPLLFGMVSMASAEADWRTYHSADGQRSFDGKLLAYDSETKTVTVVNRQRQTIDFSLDLLSEDDQDYVTEVADTLPVSIRLDVRFQELKERQNSERERSQDKDTRKVESEGGFEIAINNFSGTGYDDVKVEYLVIYHKDNPDGDGDDQILRGSETITIYPRETHLVETDTIDLMKLDERTVPKGG